MIDTGRIIVEGLGRLPEFAHAGLTDDSVFVSGTLGTGEGLVLVEGGVGPETEQALGNIAMILAAAGSGWDDAVKVNVYLSDMADFADMNKAYGAYFAGLPPARMTVGDVGLALGARVEIECVARRRGPHHVARALARRTGFVDHDGESLYYEVVGEGGIPLVLSHGAGGNHAAWFQQVAELATDRVVISWDHRGYGHSTDRADRSGPEVAAADLLAILDYLGVERADLAAQSMGGWTTVGAALARPGLARSLILADTLGGFMSEPNQAAAATRLSGALAAEALLGAHPGLDPSFSSRHPERAHLYQMLGRMGTADPAVILPRLLAVSHDAAEATLLTMPVLCIVGDRDRLFPPASVRALVDMLPDARMVEITGAGHSPYFESPAFWNAAVRQFLVAVESL